MEKKDKKVVVSILLVMTVVLLIGIAALIVGSVLGSEAFGGTSGIEENNLTSVDNVTAQNFDIVGSRPTAVCALVGAFNATGGETITSGNYTQPTTCSIIATDGSQYNGTDWTVDYTWTTPGSAGSVINLTELTVGFGGFMSGLITFLAVIGIIVGVLWLVLYIKPLFSKQDGLQSFDSS